MNDLLGKLKSVRSSGGEVKMPTFFKDVYSDLRDRHLLPLVAVLLVAIAAVPFLLKASDPDLSRTQAETSLPETIPASARLEVVADVPALRDYRDRLSELVAKDPFQQHFTAPQVEGAQLGSGSAGPTTIPTYEPPPAPAPAPDPPSVSDVPAYTPPPSSPSPAPPSSPSLPPSGDGSGTGDGDSDDGRPAEVRVETKLVSYRITARLGEPGDVKVRRNIDELTMLPNEKNPVAVFLGVSSDEKKALFLVSSEVTAVFGDTTCRFGDEQCQFIAVEPRFPVVFTYGENDRKFQLSINKIERVEEDANGRSSRDAGEPTRVGASSSAD